MGQHLKDKLYDEMTAKLRDESFMAHKGLKRGIDPIEQGLIMADKYRKRENKALLKQNARAIFSLCEQDFTPSKHANTMPQLPTSEQDDMDTEI